MIDWTALGSVALASLIAAVSIVSLFAIGLRLRSADASATRRALSVVCFALAGALVLYGVYLIVPALH